jgi:DNA-binding response OmpR family regulator
MKLLLVEDELSLAEALIPHLRDNRFEVTHVASFKDAKVVSLSKFDVILLDWALPDGEGIDLLKMWRAAGSTVPVIMLTARNDVTDKVLGLELGAHDYITKPFDIRELVARIRVQLRQEQNKPEQIQFKNIKIDLRLRKVYADQKEVTLTRKEYDLLLYLSQAENQVFTREELLNRIWGFENFPSTRTVDTHVLQLRNKLGSDLIETVHGVGYRVKV